MPQVLTQLAEENASNGRHASTVCDKHGDVVGGGQCSGCVTERYLAIRRSYQRLGEQQVETRRVAHHVPKRFVDMQFDDMTLTTDKHGGVMRVVKRFAEDFQHRLQEGANMVFVGPAGTGKTCFAMAVLHAVAAQGYKTHYTTSRELLRDVKGTYQAQATKNERDVYARYTQPDLLVIDHVAQGHSHQGHLSAAERNILFDVLDQRFNAMVCTVAISQCGLSALSSLLGESSLHRLTHQGAVLAFDWPRFVKPTTSAHRVNTQPRQPVSLLRTTAPMLRIVKKDTETHGVIQTKQKTQSDVMSFTGPANGRGVDHAI